MSQFDTRNTGYRFWAADLRGALNRGRRAALLAGCCATLLFTTASAEPKGADQESAEASNGGVATVSSGGEVTIDQIVTGENTGNSITTGDISGPASIDGGEIDYPTEVTVTQIEGPLISDASGGDAGKAETSPEDDAADANDNDNDNGKDDDLTIINKNDNRSKATLKNE